MGPTGSGVGAGRRRAVAAALLLIAVVLSAAYPAFGRTTRSYLYVAFAWAALAAALYGLRRIPPGLRPAWGLLLAALTVGAADAAILRSAAPGSSLAHATSHLSIVANVLLLAAATTLVVNRGRNDFGGLIDAAILGVAFGGTLWNIVVGPLSRAGGGPAQHLELAATLMMLTATLGALLRLVGSDRLANPALALLLVALGLDLTGLTLTGVYPAGPAELAGETAFLGAYVALTAALVGRSIHRLAQPAPRRPDRVGPVRLLFMGVALAILPVAMAVRGLVEGAVDSSFLIFATALVVPLVVTRFALLTHGLQRSEAAQRHLATHDPLTGTLNRRAFLEALDAELSTDRDYVLAFGDLDAFKQINDRFGHAAGDRLLADVADRLRACLGPGDLICRYGGDEFLMLLRDGRPVTDCVAGAMTEPFLVEGVPLTVSMSLGIVAADASGRDSATVEHLVNLADAAMYRNKSDPPAAQPG